MYELCKIRNTAADFLGISAAREECYEQKALRMQGLEKFLVFVLYGR